MKLGVLDYGGGNLRSVLNAFDAIDAHANLVTKPEDFESIDVLVGRDPQLDHAVHHAFQTVDRIEVGRVRDSNGYGVAVL